MKKGLLPSAPAGASIDGIVRKKLTRDFYLLPFRLSYLRDSDPHDEAMIDRSPNSRVRFLQAKKFSAKEISHVLDSRLLYVFLANFYNFRTEVNKHLC